jgi:hypothetical protein
LEFYQAVAPLYSRLVAARFGPNQAVLALYLVPLTKYNSRGPSQEVDMGTITPRRRKNGSVAYRARVMRDGVTYHETATFDR